MHFCARAGLAVTSGGLTSGAALARAVGELALERETTSGRNCPHGIEGVVAGLAREADSTPTAGVSGRFGSKSGIRARVAADPVGHAGKLGEPAATVPAPRTRRGLGDCFVGHCLPLSVWVTHLTGVL